MIKLTIVATAALFLAAEAPPSQNDQPAGSAQANLSLRHRLEGRYAALKAAFESKNEAAIRSVLTDDFVSIDVDGRPQDTEQMMKFVLALPRDPNRQSKTTILSITGDERAAVVEQRYDMATKLKYPDGSEKPATASTTSRDTWVNENGSWRIKRTVTEQLDGSVGGKSVAHKTNSTTR